MASPHLTLSEPPRLAVSAAIFRDGRALLMRRAREPARGLYTLPGGRVERGETLEQAVVREIAEETQLTIALAGIAAHHQAITRDEAGAVTHHFVIVVFAARWVAGEPVADAEHDAWRWVPPDAVGDLATTPDLAAIVARAAIMVPTQPALK